MRELRVDASLENMEKVQKFIQDELMDYELSLKTENEINIAIEEIFVNIASYAYTDGDGNATLAFGFDENERLMTLVIKDSGVPFNPLERAEPDISLSADEREIGGLGIFITKKTMDTVSYAYENGNNILTMTKKI